MEWERGGFQQIGSLLLQYHWWGGLNTALPLKAERKQQQHAFNSVKQAGSTEAVFCDLGSFNYIDKH